METPPHPRVSSRLTGALELAFKLRGHDVRKSFKIRVMTNLLSVCGLVLRDGRDESEAIGALLHDAIEGKPDQITLAAIKERFGSRVTDIVSISSDTPGDHIGGPKPP